jgi:hypothetical protein
MVFDSRQLSTARLAQSFVVGLEPQKLGAGEQHRLRHELAKAMDAVN